MPDRSPDPDDGRSRRWAAPIGLVTAAILLCGAGVFWTADADYDGVTSLLNPIGLGSCCCAGVFLIAAPAAWWIARDDDRPR
jgi:hypothetical protein